MDYIVMACLAGFALLMLTISYDIACQWKVNLPTRNAKLPKAIRLDLDKVEVQCGLPVWHASSHEMDCKDENSLSVLPSVGKSDGEGVERTWSDLNPAAFHTKEMAIGNRDALRRKLLVAIAERQRQVESFKEVNRTVPKELRTTWQTQIDAFVADHTKPNPYVLPNTGAPTEAELRLALKREEDEEMRKGKSEAARDPDAAEIKAECVKLYMPSELSALEREVGCLGRVIDLETWLCENQCHNALVKLRSHLHTKRHLIGFRNAHVTGQIKSTKARTLIAQVSERADASAEKYNRARAALTSLVGPHHAPHFKILKPGDMMLDDEIETEETKARKKLALIGAGKGARTPRHVPGTSKKILSWIWTAAGALDDDEKHLHESLRVEWSRAKARKLRWEEEVLILREEMRRVLRYLEWQAGWWMVRVSVREGEAEALRAGLSAYAQRQAHIHAEL
ncbi:hypothetical protein DFH06DRAFT_1340412 [Mycena polygramma]|nr:hypothetical protein DFH06DRAFT_1340409 [Mycena polygramma]KAJ7623101.1 hypothetical protein DFH06DRAFT_1340412 [Mycena polygramma]